MDSKHRSVGTNNINLAHHCTALDCVQQGAIEVYRCKHFGDVADAVNMQYFSHCLLLLLVMCYC
ncbi:hypothetical protein Deiofobo_0371 [Pseudomonas phage Deifobo]|nr:hypothetical protein Deiofobo_0371 [Pseudomonas phage Deifobo]